MYGEVTISILMNLSGAPPWVLGHLGSKREKDGG